MPFTSWSQAEGIETGKLERCHLTSSHRERNAAAQLEELNALESKWDAEISTRKTKLGKGYVEMSSWSLKLPSPNYHHATSWVEYWIQLNSKTLLFFFLNRNWLHGEGRTQDCLHRRPALIIQCGPIHISLPILDAAKLRELLPYDRRKETCRKPTLFLLPGRPNIGNIITRHPLLKARLFDGADWIFQHAREKCLTKKNQTKPDTTDLRQTMKAMCCFPCVYLYGYDF